MAKRRKYKNPRYENPLAEAERNGYEVHMRGWPSALLAKPGEPIIAFFIGSEVKGHYPDRPMVGFTKHQQTMMMLFEKMGAKVVRVR